MLDTLRSVAGLAFAAVIAACGSSVSPDDGRGGSGSGASGPVGSTASAGGGGQSASSSPDDGRGGSGSGASGPVGSTASAGGGGQSASSPSASSGSGGAHACGPCDPSPNGSGCVQPGDVCSDPCNPYLCNSDADCPEGSSYCLLSCGGVGTCMPKCSDDAGCVQRFGPGHACGADAECEPSPCSQATDCPANFDCAAGRCERDACSTDGDCAGVCVGGTCYEEPPRCVACI